MVSTNSQLTDVEYKVVVTFSEDEVRRMIEDRHHRDEMLEIVARRIYESMLFDGMRWFI